MRSRGTGCRGAPGSAGVAGASGRPASGQLASPPREVGEAGSEEECDLD